MTRRMLINAQSPEELRIAIVTDQTLDTYQVEVAEEGLTRGNIYRGIIANIQPSLNAAFIDYGAERHGFLAIQDVVPEAYYRDPKGRPRIEAVLERGRPIVVQVTREAEAQKGAVLTTNLSLAGRYLVLTPFDSTRGVSRKVEDEEIRKRLRSQLVKLEIPKGCGAIVRTNAIDQTKASLARDLAALLRLWKRVETEARTGKGTQLLYSDQDLILQALRDYLDSSVEEVLVDDDEAYARAEEYMRAFMPRAKTRLVRYAERAPLFSKFNLEPQIDRIYERQVDLPNGGSVVIDRTEALTAVDVNSGRATGGTSQAETALATNLEAAREVARQLRLRDIGGLIVVDFIDMRSLKHRRKVEKALRDAMKDDKARCHVGRLSVNGLLEINRQRLQQALSLRTHRPCPTCGGTGRIASAEMVGLNLLRRIQARAASGTLQKVRVSLHPELADGFQNNRRQEIAALEQEFDIKVEIIAASHLHRPEQEVDWFSRPRAAAAATAEPAVRSQASVHAAELAVPIAPQAAKPPAPAAEAKTPEPQEEEKGEKRTRKRRRTRRKTPKTADRTAEVVAPRREAAEPEPKGQSGGETRRKTRRKRSGKAGDGRGKDALAADRPQAAPPREDKTPAHGEGGPADDAATTPPARKRPRRRGRSRGGGGSPETAAEGA